jgi:4-aminobutyrate aminotransferase-like enzyme
MSSSPAMTTREVLQCLRHYESPHVTFIDPDGGWPIVWERARGAHAWDVEGRRYLDLTAAFGVAAAGHGNPAIVAAGQRQMTRLLHAMGDVHPHAGKARLAQALSQLTFERWTRQPTATPSPCPPNSGASNARSLTGQTIFCNSGFEAVEAALKTALLATGKPGIIAFHGAYHGLGYGALNATHRSLFRDPFRRQLGGFGHFVPYPTTPAELKPLSARLQRVFDRSRIGAILVEPIQGRGGIRIPTPAFLPLLRSLCDAHGALLVADEIFTGLGRTGTWFACEHAHVIPDVICLGKALTGGFPLSACVGRADLMSAAWPQSTGEAIHTSTYLGHPVGCAMALASLDEIRRRKLVDRSARLGRQLLTQLIALSQTPRPYQCLARGQGLMAGLELLDRHGRPATELALRLIKTMLARGFILLPEGEHANVISLTPPLTIPAAALARAVRTLGDLLP